MGVVGSLAAMSTKVSATVLGVGDKSGFLTKQGGNFKSWKTRWFVLKGDTIYYFKSKKDTEQTGEIKLVSTSSCNPEPSQSKKGRYRFSVGTVNRIFHIFSESEQDMQDWVEKISQAINIISGGASSLPKAEPAVTPLTPSSPAKTPASPPSTNTNNTSTPTAAPTATAGAPGSDRNAVKLMAAKEAIPFLRSEDSKVLEFWCIWHESVPSSEEMVDFGEDVEYQLAISAGMQKLTWRAAGPQSALIQRMVDFFWNVGAPETEIDKLNDVGASINPKRIGSWIDMSAKGGMDGGWYFPVKNSVALALNAGDTADSIDTIQAWAIKHGITECHSVGRDMGAAPPRQTEFFFQLPGGDASAQVYVALDAFETFGFPAIPEGAKQVLEGLTQTQLCLSVISSSQGFVRLGVLVPAPDRATVDRLCGVVQAAADGIRQLEKAISSQGPSFVELQHLMDGFGYGVYDEGFDVVFHYALSQ